MVRKVFAFLIILSSFHYASAVDSPNAILQRILETAKQNEELAADIGYQQITSNKKISDGKISTEKIRTHRVTWIQDKPYLELIKVNAQDLNAKEKKEEAERKAKFIKSLREKSKKDEEDITWEEMFAKYDFKQLPADSTGTYVFSFSPKAGRLPERSRAEKVLNHIAGQVWADDTFAIVRVEAKLLENVRFGLGVLGNIENLELNFQQTRFQKISVPSFFHIYFKARIAVVKTEERRIESTYTDYFRRPTVP